MFHTAKLSRRMAKSVARAQAPRGSRRIHRRIIEGILMHRIIRPLGVPMESELMKVGDIVQIHPADENQNAQGLFRVVVLSEEHRIPLC